MLQGERRNRIIEILSGNRGVTVKDLCNELEASEATIRRDLAALEDDGKLERTHGGAIPRSQTRLDTEESFLQKEARYTVQKRDIALKAFSLLAESDSIVLDAGTTTYELARLIGQTEMKITVVTNSTILANELSSNPNLELFALGGKVKLTTQATIGAVAVSQMQQFNVSKAFIGTNGVSIDQGLTTPDPEEAAIKHAMLQAASERYALADHTKFNRVAMSRIAPLSMIDAIITDKDVDPSILAPYHQREIELILA